MTPDNIDNDPVNNREKWAESNRQRMTHTSPPAQTPCLFLKKCPHFDAMKAEAAKAAREQVLDDTLDKAIKVIRNRIDCIMIAYEGEKNEDMTRKPYAMADGMNECILMLKSLRAQQGEQR